MVVRHSFGNIPSVFRGISQIIWWGQGGTLSSSEISFFPFLVHLWCSSRRRRRSSCFVEEGVIAGIPWQAQGLGLRVYAIPSALSPGSDVFFSCVSPLFEPQCNQWGFKTSKYSIISRQTKVPWKSVHNTKAPLGNLLSKDCGIETILTTKIALEAKEYSCWRAVFFLKRIEPCHLFSFHIWCFIVKMEK